MSGWIEWHGGDCPVGPFTMILYRTRSGYERKRPCAAGSVPGWIHHDEPGDIIAYRILSTPTGDSHDRS